MCGIATIFAYHYAAPAADASQMRAIRNAMANRGPDGHGEWFSPDGRVALGHRRLAILDPTLAAAQPMRSENGDFVITFNGEIYNYPELRKNLESLGRKFRTRCDTEILLHLYEEKGPEMVLELRGMFSFVIWDAKRQKLFLARDPYGIKPLYYADDGWVFRAASQVKALIAGGRISTDRDPAAVAGFLMTGSVPEPFTTHRAIRQLPAGHRMWVDLTGARQPERYFSIASIFNEASSSLDSTLELAGIYDALKDSVDHHYLSDVPVGIFLSAGIDSSAMASLSDGKKTKAITLGFKEFIDTAEDEVPLASLTAKSFGIEHHVEWVGRDSLVGDLDKIFAAMDQPTIDGLNSFLISKTAHAAGLKVVLSGLGGDELFGGYPSFSDVPRWSRQLRPLAHIPGVAALAASVFRLTPAARHQPKIAGLLRYGGHFSGAYFARRAIFMPWELSFFMGRDNASEGLERLGLFEELARALSPDPKSDYARVATLESSFYMRNQLLRDADWAGMAHSVEIRTPFVDTTLLRRLAPQLVVRNGGGKKLLASSLRRSLPEAVMRRKKTGFSLPMHAWLDSAGPDAAWKRVEMLKRPNCHWSRRWAFEVLSKFWNEEKAR